jgi:outer membrane receptor for ferrienterochelin and colicin
MFKLSLSRLLCLAAMLMLSNVAFAQSQATAGQIVGTVKDPQGAAVAGATVTVSNTATGLTQNLSSNSDGLFRAVLLPPGDYTVKVTAPGFGEFTQTGYRVEVGSTLDANITMQVNAVSEAVTVTAASVETTAVQSSATVGEKFISELPINGRRFQDFVLLTPNADVDPNRNQLTLVGQRGINTNIQIDGADYSNPFFGGIRGGERASFAPTFPQESVREFQVVTSGFNAEFGRSTGGFVNAVTKSGTNDLHGSFFYLGRPEKAATKNAFGQIASPTQHQLGGSVGGALIKNRFFYFFSGEQQLFKQTRAVLLPLLSTYSTTANPGTSEAFNFYKSLEGPYEQTNNGTTALGRLDFNFNDKHQANIRYNYSFNKAFNAVTAGTSLNPTTNSAVSNNGTEGNRQNSFVGQFNSFFTPTLINEFRGQFSREDRPRTPNVIAPLVNNGIGSFGTVSFLPTTQFDTRIQLNDNVTVNRGTHSAKFGVDYNRTYADQLFAFRQTGNFQFLNLGTGTADLTTIMRILSVGSAVTGMAAGNPVDTANRFDDTRIRYIRNIGNGMVDMTSHELAFFAQDAWKVRPNFTLSYGLRWEAQFMPQPDTSNTALTDALRNARLPLYGQRGINPGVIPDQTDQWAPRIGVAWDPFKDGKTVVRFGTGIFYARTPLLSLAGPLNNFRTPPGDVSITIDGITTASAPGTPCAVLTNANCPNTIYKLFQTIGINLNNFTLDKLPILTVQQAQQLNQNRLAAIGQTANPLNGLQVVTVGDELKNPRSFQVNFGAEREVRSGLTLGITFDVVNTVHLNRNRDIDVAEPYIRPGDRSLRPSFLGRNRPITQLGNSGYVQVREASARSRYNALTFRTLYRRAWGQFDVNYTLSKSLDDDSTERNATFAEYENTYNLTPEYNYSRNDRPHRFNFSALFNLKYGFQFSTLGRFQSGQPIDVIVNSIVAPTGSGLTAAQYAAQVRLPGSTGTGGDLNNDSGNFNDRPYSAPGVPFLRNSYRNYGSKNIDFRLQRDFKIGEKFSFSPSFEMFNAFKFRNFRLNGAAIFNYGNPGVNENTGEVLLPSNPSFLQLRNANGTYNLNNLAGVPRALQFGIRVKF